MFGVEAIGKFYDQLNGTMRNFNRSMTSRSLIHLTLRSVAKTTIRAF